MEGECAVDDEWKDDRRKGGREGGRVFTSASLQQCSFSSFRLVSSLTHLPPPFPSLQPSFPPSTFSQQRAEALRVLGLSPLLPEEDVREEGVKEAFRKKAMECHPDR